MDEASTLNRGDFKILTFFDLMILHWLSSFQGVGERFDNRNVCSCLEVCLEVSFVCLPFQSALSWISCCKRDELYQLSGERCFIVSVKLGVVPMELAVGPFRHHILVVNASSLICLVFGGRDTGQS